MVASAFSALTFPLPLSLVVGLLVGFVEVDTETQCDGPLWRCFIGLKGISFLHVVLRPDLPRPRPDVFLDFPSIGGFICKTR